MFPQGIHFLHGGDRAFMVPHTQFQSEIATDEKEPIEGAGISPRPGDAGDEDAKGDHHHREYSLPILSPPQLKQNAAQNHRQEGWLYVEGDSDKDPKEKQLLPGDI